MNKFKDLGTFNETNKHVSYNDSIQKSLDAMDDVIEKAGKNPNLIEKKIINKLGHKQTVWVSPEDAVKLEKHGALPLDHVKHGITLHEEPVKTSYEKSGERHTSHSGFTQGDKVKLEAGGKQITGEFKHVNINKHSPKGYAVIRGEDGKLYERGIGKVEKVGNVETIVKPVTTEKQAEKPKEITATTPAEFKAIDSFFRERMRVANNSGNSDLMVSTYNEYNNFLSKHKHLARETNKLVLGGVKGDKHGISHDFFVGGDKFSYIVKKNTKGSGGNIYELSKNGQVLAKEKINGGGERLHPATISSRFKELAEGHLDGSHIDKIVGNLPSFINKNIMNDIDSANTHANLDNAIAKHGLGSVEKTGGDYTFHSSDTSKDGGIPHIKSSLKVIKGHLKQHLK